MGEDEQVGGAEFRLHVRHQAPCIDVENVPPGESQSRGPLTEIHGQKDTSGDWKLKMLLKLL